jgi:hypothetical protein
LNYESGSLLPETAMTATAPRLEALRRPRLLIRAARHGLAEYDRNRDLRRLLAAPAPPPPERAVAQLLASEARLEAARRAQDAGYSVARHVEVLIALIAEARLAARAGAS